MSASSTSTIIHIGVGFDTARYGHRVTFLREDRQPATKAYDFRECADGYQQVRDTLQSLQERHGQVHFDIRIDAAGQYAANLEHFLRQLPFDKTISVGQPKQNKDYRSVHFPKRKADEVESIACARFAVVERPPASREVPPAFAQLSEVASSLQFCVKENTRLINHLHNRLARAFPELALEVNHLSAAWALQLLDKYPTAAEIADASLDKLTAIPHLDEERAKSLKHAAQRSVASHQGTLMAEVVRQAARALQQGKDNQTRLEKLLDQAYESLPESGHVFINTIPGIGKKTAAALVAKMVSIDRFETPDDVVGYFGVFPEENSSGLDKHGRPLPPGTMRMSHKGNDLVRGYLWNAAKSAITHNPTIRAFYARLRKAGKRGDVAIGHCMRKLLHLVFAVWKTGKPYAAPDVEKAGNVKDEAVVAEQIEEKLKEEAVGRKEQRSKRQAVTTAPAIINAAPSAGQHVPRETVDFAELRRHITIEQVLREARWLDRLRLRGRHLRGPCPIHCQRGENGSSFSADIHKNIFRCFDRSCGAQGNALDLWVHIQKRPIEEAAPDLAERIGLRNREEEPVNQHRPKHRE